MRAKEFIRKRKYYEKKYFRKMIKALQDQFKPVLDELDKNFDLVIDMIPQLIKEDIIRDAFLELYMDVGNKFRGIVQVKKDFEEDIWFERMKEFVEAECSNKIKTITRYSRELAIDIVRSSVDEGFEQGLSMGDITRLIKEKVPVSWRKETISRAPTIARTEVMTASNVASYLQVQDMGVEIMKVWRTAPRGFAKTERHNLMNLNGQKRSMNESFDVGGRAMLYPGDENGGAENIINCNCMLDYETV